MAPARQRELEDDEHRAPEALPQRQCRRRAPTSLIDSAVPVVVTGYRAPGRGRSVTPAASRPTTSAIRDARRSGRRVVASMYRRQAPAVELRQRAEAGPSGPVSRQCRADVAGKPVARWAVRRPFHDRRGAGRQARLPHPRRVPGARPSAVAGRDRHPSPAAMDRAADLRHGLGAPCLVRVKRNRDNGVTAGIGRDLGAKPFTAHGLIPPPRRPALHKRVPGWVPVPPVLSAEGNMSFRNAQPG
jgi:hypothetical protein